MAKAPTKSNDAAAPATGAQLMPVPTIPVNVTADTLDRCRRDLHVKLARAITTNHESADAGVISQLVADLRALTLVSPARAPAPVVPAQPDDPETAERKAAAENPALMQKYNQKIAAKEAIDAEHAKD